MSRASERKAMRETLAGYSLMSVPELAAFLGCSDAVAREEVDQGRIPTVRIGGRKKVDPIDAAVHVLAGREGLVTADGYPDHDAYWRRHGEATAEHVRRYVVRIRKATGVAA